VSTRMGARGRRPAPRGFCVNLNDTGVWQAYLSLPLRYGSVIEIVERLISSSGSCEAEG